MPAEIDQEETVYLAGMAATFPLQLFSLSGDRPLSHVNRTHRFLQLRMDPRAILA